MPSASRASRVVSRCGRASSMIPRSRNGDARPTSEDAAMRMPTSATRPVYGRGTDPGNRRSVLVSLTDVGRGVLDELAEARRATATELFGELTAAEQRTLLDLLTRLDRN